MIKKARGSMSQRAFGKLLGVSATAVQLWEKGDTLPDTENLAKIAARSGYTLSELLGFLEGKPVSEPSELNQILNKIKVMPLAHVAMISRAVADRFSEAAESSGDEAKAS
ncbi:MULTISPECIES: helix-turn-helix domain-containing protein [Aerosakkonema]|uniref:helix-turn-helix domain-containing protein n=1 Tax=Aerosakkonema TaxID=1246629 RepID=UPI0035B829A2